MTLEFGKNNCAKSVVKRGAAKGVRDIIIRHNSDGSLSTNYFYAENSQRLYISYPNCNAGYQGRHDVIMTDVVASNVNYLAGSNKNYGDIVTLKNSKITGGSGCCIIMGKLQKP